MQRTFAMVKPDGVRRGLSGEIIRRVEAKGFRVIALKRMRIDQELAERHYGEHRGKPFFAGLIAFITSGPVTAMVVEGPDAIAQLRRMMGETDPVKSAPGSIRGDLAVSIDENVIHGSAAPEDASREIELFFRPDEIVT
jgi:nucleoside-diphosphate kinase